MQFTCTQLKLHTKIQGDTEYTDLGRGKRRGRSVLLPLEKLSMLNSCSKITENMPLIRQFKQSCGVISPQFFRWADVPTQSNPIIWGGGGLIKLKGILKKIIKASQSSFNTCSHQQNVRESLFFFGHEHLHNYKHDVLHKLRGNKSVNLLIHTYCGIIFLYETEKKVKEG